MTYPAYQPLHRRQNARLGGQEGGRRQETSIYPAYSKVKEMQSPGKSMFSRSYIATHGKKWGRKRFPRGKTANTIIQTAPESYEMKELDAVKISDEGGLQINRTPPAEPSPIPSKKMPRVLSPSGVMTPEFVLLNPSSPESPAHNSDHRSFLSQPHPPVVVIEAQQNTSADRMSQTNTTQREPNFHPAAMNDSAFWGEWSNISYCRTSILSLRSRTHEMRRILREKQNKAAFTQDRLIQRVLQQGLSVKPDLNMKGSYSSPESILDLVKDCQDARDEYGPFEDQCTSLEDQLYRDEFFLHRLEEQFYLRWKVVPDLRGGYSESSQKEHESPPIPSVDFQDEEHYEGEVKFHPMVDRYLSRKGDLDILNEQLYDFEERVAEVEEDRESRERYGLKPDPEDEEFRATSTATRYRILSQIQETKDDVEKLQAECFSMKLVDEYGDPTNPESEEWKFAEIDEEHSSSLKLSEYPKYSILVTQPERVYSDFTEGDTKESSRGTKSSQVITSTSSNQVEFWMLMILRCSVINANHLARLSQIRGIMINDIWQKDVLKFWFKKESSKPSSGNRTRSGSLTTQPPELQKQPNAVTTFSIELPILQKAYSARRFRSHSAKSFGGYNF